MVKLRVKYLEKSGNCLTHYNTRFYMNNEQFVKYFLSPNFEYEFVEENEKADICIFSIRHIGEKFTDAINILVSIENIPHWKSMNTKDYKKYFHHKKFGDYGNKSIDIFLYNHISSLSKLNNSLAIPTIYSRINYFKNFEKYYNDHFFLKTNFNEKKNFLKFKRSGGGKDFYNSFIDYLSNFEYELDDITNYNDLLENKSCYNSIEFLEVLNKYKFVVCFENSVGNGYITEKIFNCFFGKTIPIYFGAPDVNKFINKDSFIRIESEKDFSNALKIINELITNEEKYNEFINREKISNDFNDENYIEEFDNIIKKKLNL